MGVSTDGQLCYGILLDEEDHGIPEDAEGEWPSWDWEKRLNDAGFTLVNVCSVDFPIWMLAIKDSEVIAYRGCPKKLTTPLVADDDWDAQLQQVIESENLTVEDSAEFGWYLSSYWG